MPYDSDNDNVSPMIRTSSRGRVQGGGIFSNGFGLGGVDFREVFFRDTSRNNPMSMTHEDEDLDPSPAPATSKNAEKDYFCPKEFESEQDDEEDDHDETKCHICHNGVAESMSIIKKCIIWDKNNIDSVTPKAADQMILDVYEKSFVKPHMMKINASRRYGRPIPVSELDVPTIDHKSLNIHWKKHGFHEHREIVRDLKVLKTIEKKILTNRTTYKTKNGGENVDLTTVETYLKLNKYKYQLATRLSDFKTNLTKTQNTSSVRAIEK